LDNIIKDTDNLKHTLVYYDYGTEFSSPIMNKEADEIIHYASISEKEYLEEQNQTDGWVYNHVGEYMQNKSSFYLTDDKLIITRDRYDLNDIYIDYSIKK